MEVQGCRKGMEGAAKDGGLLQSCRGYYGGAETSAEVQRILGARTAAEEWRVPRRSGLEQHKTKIYHWFC